MIKNDLEKFRLIVLNSPEAVRDLGRCVILYKGLACMNNSVISEVSCQLNCSSSRANDYAIMLKNTK